MSIFPTTVLLATDGSEEQSWWCAITKRDTHSTLHLLSSTFRNYTHSEPRFRALLTEGASEARWHWSSGKTLVPGSRATADYERSSTFGSQPTTAARQLRRPSLPRSQDAQDQRQTPP
jgi:hypothetical protein